ncbi:MAG TPA: cytochrome c oxidase subunit II [Actinomycetota bacterium]|nr:cytochrome c oxidase subunit II [Actinomycetota bacterium]
MWESFLCSPGRPVGLPESSISRGPGREARRPRQSVSSTRPTKGATIPPVASAARITHRTASKAKVGLAGAALVILAGCNANFGLPASVTAQGDEVTRVWRIFFLTAAGVGTLVWGLILWSVVRYRRRSDELPKQTLFHIPIEVAYTTIPLIIVSVLFVVSMQATETVNARVHDPDVTVEVTGFQWQWRFNYPEHGFDIVGETGRPAEMVLPQGATVRVILSSTDVIHAFWLPEFMVKRDAIPGRINEFDMTVTQAGTFDSGRCVEYCGLRHDDMRFTIRVVPQAEFDSWAAGALATGGTT